MKREGRERRSKERKNRPSVYIFEKEVQAQCTLATYALTYSFILIIVRSILSSDPY
jgi:hypothetical protein